MLSGRQRASATRRVGERLGLALVGLICCLIPASRLLAQVEDLGSYSNWVKEPVDWGQVQVIDDSATFLGPLTANYNMAYGATVLGLNARQGGTVYYAVIANYHDGQVDVLDAFGPFAGPVQWQSGPYHLAAGLPDGRLIAFLTAPGRYPERVRLSLDYAPRTPFYCVARPPQPINDNWPQWTLSAAFQEEPPDSQLIVETFNGQGRLLDSAQPLDLSGQLRSVVYIDLPVPGSSIPVLGLVTSRGVAAAWHEYAWGWHVDQLANSALANCQLAVAPKADSPSLLAFYRDTSDPYGLPQLQQIDLSYHQGEVTIRWGRTAVLAGQLEFRSVGFIESQLATLPLAAIATDSDIHLVSLTTERIRGQPQLAIQDVLLYSGERRTGDDGNPPRFPILAIAGAAHWRTGYPEVFWVQLGSEFGGSGQLFRLAYQPQQR